MHMMIKDTAREGGVRDGSRNGRRRKSSRAEGKQK